MTVAPPDPQISPYRCPTRAVLCTEQAPTHCPTLHTAAANEAVTAPTMVRKAFEILNLFSIGTRTLTMREIARRCDLPKSTSHRLVSELVGLGALERAADGYRVGTGMFRLGMLSIDSRHFDVAFPHLRRLHAVARRTVHLAMLDGDHAMYIDKLVGGQSPDTPALIGGALPAWRTAVGKALLAFRDPQQLTLEAGRYTEPTSTFTTSMPLGAYLRQVGTAGFAIERDESAPGVGCIAAPILRDRTAVAAVSVVIHSDERSALELVAPVRQTAAAISSALRKIAA